MKITYEQLEEERACKPGLDWFRETFGSEVEITKENLDEFPVNYREWLICIFFDIIPLEISVKYPETLEYAASRRHIDIVKLLLSQGADADNPIALERAAQSGDIDMVRLLLEYGANGRDTQALNYASWNGHDEIVQLLKERMKY